MEILAHRGYWKKNDEKNTLLALKSALENSYGFESDIRDFEGRLVVSHNVATVNSPLAEDIFIELKHYMDNYVFAINVKADGLGDMLLEAITRHHLSKYFLFDMSIPQMIEFAEKKLNFYTRQSDVEPVPVMLEEACGVWMDSFYDQYLPTLRMVDHNLSLGKNVCLVSPDLHGRRPDSFWYALRESGLGYNERLQLCTDMPDQARKFFTNVEGVN